MFKTVLFAIDRSQESVEAASKVIELVKTHNSSLIVLSVVAESDNPDAAHKATSELLDSANQMFSDKGIEARAIEREGKPSFTICDVADEMEADLIVMGCKGMDLAHEGEGKSTSHRVIDLSPCPVLLIP
ncbi:MAG: universal stress protein [Cyanophyceae cyanobacterium]